VPELQAALAASAGEKKVRARGEGGGAGTVRMHSIFSESGGFEARNLPELLYVSVCVCWKEGDARE